MSDHSARCDMYLGSNLGKVDTEKISSHLLFVSCSLKNSGDEELLTKFNYGIQTFVISEIRGKK